MLSKNAWQICSIDGLRGLSRSRSPGMARRTQITDDPRLRAPSPCTRIFTPRHPLLRVRLLAAVYQKARSRYMHHFFHSRILTKSSQKASLSEKTKMTKSDFFSFSSGRLYIYPQKIEALRCSLAATRGASALWGAKRERAALRPPVGGFNLCFAHQT